MVKTILAAVKSRSQLSGRKRAMAEALAVLRISKLSITPTGEGSWSPGTLQMANASLEVTIAALPASPRLTLQAAFAPPIGNDTQSDRLVRSGLDYKHVQPVPKPSMIQ